MMWLTILILVLNKLIEKYALTQENYFLSFCMSFKLLVDHSIMLDSICAMNINWSVEMETAFYILESWMIKIFSQLIQFRCLFDQTIEMPVFYQNMIFMVFYPFMVSLWISLVLCFFAMIYQRSISIVVPKAKIISSIIITFWLLQPTITREIFKAVTCVGIDIDGKKQFRLYHDQEIECWAESHMNYMNCLIIPSGIVYIFLFPATIFYLIRREKECPTDTKHNPHQRHDSNDENLT